jgi:hypothetical protein
MEMISCLGFINHMKQCTAFTEVIDCLYEKLKSDDTRLCLMFLDAGHQYEALLDVMLVLGKSEGVLLTSGCQEIISKSYSVKASRLSTSHRKCVVVCKMPAYFQACFRLKEIMFACSFHRQMW